MKTEAQRRAKRAYKKKCKRYVIECYPTESAIIEKLEKEKQRSGYSSYIKCLIADDLQLDAVIAHVSPETTAALIKAGRAAIKEALKNG